MIEITDYVPVLSGKTAEYAALGVLDRRVRARVRPLLEIAPIAIDPQTDQASKTLDAHLDRDVDQLRRHWAAQQLSMFDEPADPPSVLYDVRNVEGRRTQSGEHPIARLHARLAAIAVRGTPVTTLGKDSEHLAAVAAVAHEGGVCIRLDRNQWADPDHLAAESVALLTELGIEPSNVDVVIDLGQLRPEDASSALLLARGALRAMPAVHEWRSVVVAASSFPSTVSDAVELHDAVVIRRAEWEMYERLASEIELLPRMPTFADYGIEGAAGLNGGVAPTFVGKWISASIRYTGIGGWFVVRGGRLADEGHDQYHKLAAQVIDSAHWQSEGFSWGDQYIGRCARHEVAPGTPQLWRQVAVSHHITTVVKDLSTLLET